MPRCIAKFTSLLLAAFGALALSACTSQPAELESIPLAEGPVQQPDFDVDGLLQKPYLLHPADEITMTVFRVPDLSGTYRIDNSGNVLLPLIGETGAAGLSSAELSAKLERLYGSRYLQDPSITVGLKAAVGNRFSVDGAVRSPGVFDANPSTTLLESLALARGLSDEASSRVVILRKVDGEKYAAAFDIGMVRRGEQPNPAIYGGDVIVADGRGQGLETRDFLQFVPLIALFIRLL